MSNNDDDAAHDQRHRSFDVPISPHRPILVPWQQRTRGGSREDRMLREVTVNLPPLIERVDLHLPPAITAASDDALTAIVHLDAAHGEDLTSLSTLLLRAESVASSKIERIEATTEDFARAAHGMRSNSSATAMVASSHALHSLITSAAGGAAITMENLLEAHRVLMADDPQESHYAGKVRDMQNWIGGSDHSPRGALFVPPPAEKVYDYLDDLLAFINRDDVPVLTQAAIAHAQFESIHPFTDGNGRIGRALINTIFRRRGITSHVVVPLASALVSHRETYFRTLTAYRAGNAGPIIRAFTRSGHAAAQESEVTAEILSDMPSDWEQSYTLLTGRPPRKGSAAFKILRELPQKPFFTAEEMEALIGGSTSSTYAAIEVLRQSGILRPLTDRKRMQVWGTGTIIDELDDLGIRIAEKSRRDIVWSEVSEASAATLRETLRPVQEQAKLIVESYLSPVAEEMRTTLQTLHDQINRDAVIPEPLRQALQEFSKALKGWEISATDPDSSPEDRDDDDL